MGSKKSKSPDFLSDLTKEAKTTFEPIYKIKEKEKETSSLNEARAKIIEKFSKDSDENLQLLNDSVKNVEKEIVRSSILNTGKRIDGRDLDTVREIDVKVDILENVHRSSLFTRGETQAIVSTTLGTSSDEQMLDTLDGDLKEKFMLHYNFLHILLMKLGG